MKQTLIKGVIALVAGLLLIAFRDNAQLCLCFAGGTLLVLGALDQYFTLLQARLFNVAFWVLPTMVLLFGLLIMVCPTLIADREFLCFGIAALVYAVAAFMNGVKISILHSAAAKTAKAQSLAQVEDAEVVESEE